MARPAGGGMIGPLTDVYQQVIDVLGCCKRVLVTMHVRPDGDVLGSAAAVLGMRQVRIEAKVLLLSHLLCYSGPGRCCKRCIDDPNCLKLIESFYG